MGKRRLGIAVLGLGLALLLMAGCVDKDCVPCFPQPVEPFAGAEAIPDKYVVKLSARVTDGQAYCANLFQNGVPVSAEVCAAPMDAEINAEDTEINASFFVGFSQSCFIFTLLVKHIT